MSPHCERSKYPAHFKQYRAPEINLPFGGRLSKVIYTYYDIEDEIARSDPRKNAVCKTCDKALSVIIGSNSLSSYTRAP